MITLRTYFDCVEYFRDRMEKCGYRFDFIDNVYTGNQFVVINGYRAKVRGCGAATPLKEVFSALQDATKEAWQKFCTITHELKIIQTGI